jgi:hypothetical protein
MSDSGASREMSLDEWVKELPPIHRACREWNELQELVADRSKSIVKMQEAMDALYEENKKLKEAK